MTSVLPRSTDIDRPARLVRFVPILLQKSFWGVERKFLEPLVRFARGADIPQRCGKRYNSFQCSPGLQPTSGAPIECANWLESCWDSLN
jgi:hypothetical protein